MPAPVYAMRRLATTASASIAIFSLFVLQIGRIGAEKVVQDPMEAQANSFGWLAIRNFTYCLSSNPDPPNKPLGVQPTKQMTSKLNGAKKELTGMGDSVVVLYHPEETTRAIAWCNTLVAMQSTDHMICHMAVPTCQRCEAVRSKSTSGGDKIKVASGEGGVVGKVVVQTKSAQEGNNEDQQVNKAPSKKLGQSNEQSSAKERKDGGTSKTNTGDSHSGDKNLVALLKRDQGSNVPNVPLGILSDSSSAGKTPRPFGSISSSDLESRLSSADDSYAASGDIDPLSDPELRSAILEFQDYCENKLTLAVRADCPLHTVKDWADEPPFDLHRFCMTMHSVPPQSLHSEPDLGSSRPDGTEEGNSGKSQPKQSGGDDKGDAGDGGRIEKVGKGETGMQAKTSAKGVVDPDDPWIPYPDDGGTSKASWQKKIAGGS
ncbi:uncharacterized protein MEPE_04116 [Melanopsichium pennsylvanicum]|uniref:Uncharacterized protein n=2 Tax=Melanopsichium pennsylvanicum TaxID=63383 RepID=A0AAJ4XPB0_9BASI|nr:putative protein [Melanopsichium pennsylvanicum 4]SNX85407.1 uncharacterized protein MEPE_04116 [Melanopsichium pennsylvanicum]